VPYALTGLDWAGLPGGVAAATERPGWTTFYATVADVPAAIALAVP
jgi:hypothetical protein